MRLKFLMSAYSLAAIRHSSTICEQRLLTDAVTVQRIAGFHRWAARLGTLGARSGGAPGQRWALRCGPRL